MSPYVKNLKQWRYTVILVLMGGILIELSFFRILEPWEFLNNGLQTLEQYQLDEVVLFAVLLILGLTSDFVRQRRSHAEELRQKRVRPRLVVTRTLYDSFGNALNNLQLLRFEAEESRSVSQESLDAFDSAVASMVEQLRKLEERHKVLFASGSGGFEFLAYEELQERPAQ